MKKIFGVLAPAALLSVTACAGSMYQQPYAAEPLTMTQAQGRCFSTFQEFMAQTNCINNAVITSGLAPNSYVQEYLAYMQSLREKVKRKTISESTARAQLASKLNEVKAQQNNEDAMQEQLANQSAAQNAEILKQYQYKPILLEMPQPRHIPRTVQTNCSTIGTQVNCTTR